MLLRTGAVLGGKYRLEEQLGSGGMGTVWRGHDEVLGRDVAVKTLHVARATEASASEYGEAVGRFHREARAAGVLDSAHIVPMYDLGTARDDAGASVPYLVMQLVSGESLADRLREERPLTVGTSVRIAAQVCHALAAAHAAGVVHRDIKPSNIMLTRAGDAKVVDFGIAKFLADVTGNDVTATDQAAIGTLLYMAPERFQRDTPASGADLYALGCVLYEMITGSPPFHSEAAAALVRQHLNEAPRPVRQVRPGVPEMLERLIGQLLAKSAEARPTAQDAARALESIGQEISAPGRHVEETLTEPPPRNRRLRGVPLPGRRGKIGLAAVAVATCGAIVALIVLPGAEAGTKGAKVDDTRTIAVVGDFEGAGKANARTALNSVRMALERANRDQQSTFKAVTFDDAGTQDGAQRAAERVVADERIAAVVAPVGDPDSEIMAEASKTYAQHGIVVLSPWARLTSDLGATTYQVMGATEVLEQDTADFLSGLDDKALKGAWYLSDGSDEGSAAVGRLFGLTTTAGFASNSSPIDDDVEGTVREIQASGANAVYYNGDTDTLKKLDTALSKAGFDGLRVTVDAAMDGRYEVKAPWLATRDYCSWVDSFDTDYKEKYDAEAEVGGVESYDAAQALIAALEEKPEGSGAVAQRDAVARNIGEVSPRGLCHSDMRFGRDGYLLAPRTFMDLYDQGEHEASELGDVGSEEVTDRAETMLR